MDKKVLDKMTTTWQEWRYPTKKKKKKLLKESSPGYDNREFGDPLPTLADTAKAYADKNIEEDELNEDKPMGPFIVVIRDAGGYNVVSYKSMKEAQDLYGTRAALVLAKVIKSKSL